jgi:hypothetical protein
VKHHRCPDGIEPLIHAKSRHFFDFAFIFEPKSEFYRRSKTGEKGWCVHPFYQWLPAQRENAVLDPGGVYDLYLALSAKNFGTVRYSVTVDCWQGEMPPTFTKDCAFEIVGDEGSKNCPVKIRNITLLERQYSI